MLFSSVSFIYYFLPFVILWYMAVPKQYKNYILLIASLFFYAFGEPKYVMLLVFSSVIDYLHGLIIDKHRGTPKAKRALLSSLIINLAMLAFFKYSDFFIANINALCHTNFALLRLKLPIGISFYTFQTMSYSIDVYRGEAEVQKNPLKLATYVSLFPQLIAGPIVRYRTVAQEINNRSASFADFAYGVKRFVLGISKKVLIANTLGQLNVLTQKTANPSMLFLWLGAIAFALQIYFDFSGYSDMAIGLGRMFGFHFLENFNYPYISQSISEFWSRWHISLGTWFRDYVYIPLGGNRVSKVKWLRNILFVWFLTGLWHGASWNFVIWGLYFGIILVAEKLFGLKYLKQIPKLLRHFYVIIVVLFSFVIFNTESIYVLLQYLQGMIGLLPIPVLNAESLYYLRSYLVILLIAGVGATPLVKNLWDSIKTTALKPVFNVLEPGGYILLLVVVTGYLVDSSFNPFLYFRF